VIFINGKLAFNKVFFLQTFDNIDVITPRWMKGLMWFKKGRERFSVA